MTIRESIRETVQGLHDSGIIDSVTARNFEHLGVMVVPEIYTAEAIAKVRKDVKMSQDAFARLLNISKRTIQKWEQGEGKPSALGRKLLDVVSRKGAAALY